MMSLPRSEVDEALAAGRLPARAAGSRLRLAGRLLLLIPHLAYGLLLALALRMGAGRRLDPQLLAQHWSRGLLRILGLRLKLSGPAPREGGLIVANHVSWLDIPVLFASRPLRFVSKSEVRHWPIAGWLADAAGTFYIRRGKGGSRPLIRRLRPHLESGGSVAVFPEGTTTAGREVMAFHPRLFAAAIESRRPVHVVALRYSRDSDGADLAPFIGDDDLVSHLLRLLRSPGLTVELRYCAELCPQQRSREDLANGAHAAISRVLQAPPE